MNAAQARFRLAGQSLIARGSHGAKGGPDKARALLRERIGRAIVSDRSSDGTHETLTEIDMSIAAYNELAAQHMWPKLNSFGEEEPPCFSET